MLKRGDKSQASMEFVMRYAWAIMVFFAAVGALAYFGVLSPAKLLPSSCIMEPGIGCIEFKVNQDSVTLLLRNGRGEDLNISSIRVTNCSGSTSGILKNTKLGQFVIEGCWNKPNTKYVGEINLSYVGDSKVAHTKIGKIVDNVETGCYGTCDCANTDFSCGNYPSCANCNAQDWYSLNYCIANDVYRNFSDSFCSNFQCASSLSPQLVQICTNGICLNGACSCSNTDTSCGNFPSCNNCNAQDTYSSNYCNGNSVYRNFSDYSCSSQTCNPTIIPQLQQNCGSNNGICQSGVCGCANTQSSCGTYPSCQTCGANQACQNNQCVTQTCSDGTPVNSCSATKPLYCNSGGSLVNSCSTCGCPSGKACQGDGTCVNAVAQFSASYSNLQKNSNGAPPGFGGGNWWYYDVTLRENGGIIGITVNSRQKCYSSNVYGNWCDPIKTDIVARFGTNYIPPGGQIFWSNNWIWFTSGQTGTVTETFWGIDGNGNNVQSSYSLTVTSN